MSIPIHPNDPLCYFICLRVLDAFDNCALQSSERRQQYYSVEGSSVMCAWEKLRFNLVQLRHWTTFQENEWKKKIGQQNCKQDQSSFIQILKIVTHYWPSRQFDWYRAASQATRVRQIPHYKGMLKGYHLVNFCSNERFVKLPNIYHFLYHHTSFKSCPHS